MVRRKMSDEKVEFLRYSEIDLFPVVFQARKTYKKVGEASEADADDLERRLYQWATSRCSQKEYCRSELAQKMRLKGATSSMIERVLQQLERERYVDENRYARAFVSDKFRFESWGKIKIRFTLQHKGISSTDIEEALSTIAEADYMEALKVFLQRKLKTTRGDTAYDVKRKVARAAISRGYEPQLVFSCLSLEEIEYEM